MNLRCQPSLGRQHRRAFSFVDLLLVLATLLVLVALALPVVAKSRARTRQAVCEGNLRRVTGAILNYAQSEGRLPAEDAPVKGPLWWFYKELVKGDLGLKGPSSPLDRVFACPNDRGYEGNRPFRLGAKFDYGSYVYNGVTLSGVTNLPSVVGRSIASIKEPSATLLVMEWTAHGPLSWHRSATGRRNHPFYNNAESVVGFVDGHVDMIPIYYDGMNPAYTREPIPGYAYKYGAD